MMRSSQATIFGISFYECKGIHLLHKSGWKVSELAKLFNIDVAVVKKILKTKISYKCKINESS